MKWLGSNAPKHVQQLVEKNHLRWDSLGEFLALAVSLEDVGIETGQIDNRGSQFYLAMYWAQALAAQTGDAALAAHFAPLARALADNEQKIMDEFNAVQGAPADIGGYYLADTAKVTAIMRPSGTFNAVMAAASA